MIAIYAERLRRRGHQVTVVSTPPWPIAFRTKVKSVLSGRGWPREPSRWPSHFDGLEVTHHVIDRWRPVADADVPDADVVVATWWRTAYWVDALSARKGAKAIFLQGYEVLPGQEKPLLDSTWRLPLHKIAISKWLVDLARTRFGDGRVSLVPNSVDTAQFSAPPRGKQARATVGFLYSTSAFKACEVAIEAIRIARAALPELSVVCFGADRPNDVLPLPADFEFSYRPPQALIPAIYRRCDVWLCSSVREGFHLPLLEAMACRCPVVSTRAGGPEDIVNDGSNGFLVTVGDAGAMAERLLRVVGLPEERWRAMSDAAYAMATRYTWDDATTLFEQALVRTVEDAKQEVGE